MRYQPHTKLSRQEMLDYIGVNSIESLFQDVPAESLSSYFDLPNHKTEIEVDKFFKGLASRNWTPGDLPSFLGGGIYHHHVPASVDHLIQRGEFLTSYTPYQPEISQGTLQYLYEFQTQVATLLGMDVANASMYDGATAAAESVMMACRITKRSKCIVSENLHPHYLETISTYGNFAGFEIMPRAIETDLEDGLHKGCRETPHDLSKLIDDETACVIVQYPDFFGNISDFTELSKACHAKGVLLITVTTEMISLGLLKSPGEMGADIAVAEGQSIGNMPNFGGPTIGLFATKQKYVRQLPGRIVGETNDVDGNRGWVLTLSTREQHIRREKATSNICTNSGLCALAFTIHMTLLGGVGLKKLAQLNHAKARKLHASLSSINNVSPLQQTYFNEFLVKLPVTAEVIVERLAEQGILAGIPLTRFSQLKQYQKYMLVCATEMISDSDIDLYVKLLSAEVQK